VTWLDVVDELGREKPLVGAKTTQCPLDRCGVEGERPRLIFGVLHVKQISGPVTIAIRTTGRRLVQATLSADRDPDQEQRMDGVPTPGLTG